MSMLPIYPYTIYKTAPTVTLPNIADTAKNII